MFIYFCRQDWGEDGMLWMRAAPAHHSIKMEGVWLAGSSQEPELPHPLPAWLLPSPSPGLLLHLPSPFEAASGLELSLNQPLDVLFIFMP